MPISNKTRCAFTLLAAIASTSALAESSAPSLNKAELDASAKRAVEAEATQPEKLVLVGGALGWVKYCEAEGDKCVVSRGFAPGPIYPTKLDLTFETKPTNDLYRVRVILPLGMEVDAGFAVSFGTPTAYLGTYRSCSTSGCFGDVFLKPEVFDSLKEAKVVDVIVKTDKGRQVTIEGPMDGFAEALTKAPDKVADVIAKEQEITKQLSAEIEASRSKREAGASAKDEPVKTDANAEIGAKADAGATSR